MREEYCRNRDVNEAELRGGKTVLSSKPRSLIVTLTSDCNLRCTMCDVWKRSWHLPERAAGEVRDLIPYLLKVVWQGGEVFLSPLFRELFTAAAEGVEQAVVTNGLLIDENWVGTLARKNVTLIISIDGARKETYEAIRQGADFERLCRNLERLASAKTSGLRLVMQMVLGKDNWQDLDLVPGFISRYKIDRLQLLPLRPGNLERETFNGDGDAAVVNEVARRIAAIEEKGRAEGFEVLNVLPRPPAACGPAAGGKEEKHQAAAAPAQPAVKCRWPWQQLIIDRFGEVRIHCFCDAVIGDINTQRLEDIWNGEAMVRARERMLAGDLSGCTPRCASGAIGADELGLWR